MAWSDDGRFLAFVEPGYPIRTFYIADLQEKLITDTCISATDGVAWIPNSHEFAYIQNESSSSETALVVVDVDTWSTYISAYHTGTVLGWRGD